MSWSYGQAVFAHEAAHARAMRERECRKQAASVDLVRADRLATAGTHGMVAIFRV